MRKLIDLTGTISNGMWHYPDPFLVPKMRHTKRTADWGINSEFYVDEIHASTLVGTYFETPAHFFKGAFTVDQWPVKEFIREALLVKIPKSACGAITLDEVRAYLTRRKLDIARGESVLFATGWDGLWDKQETFVKESPYFDDHLIDWLLEREISLLGGDIPSFDNIRAAQGFMPHLLRKGVVIVAPLVNLMCIPSPRIKLYLFPLKLKGACASPCRVICEFESEH